MCCNNVDSVAVTAATRGDVITLTREPASLYVDVGESSTHLRHPVTAQLIALSPASDTPSRRSGLIFPSTATTQHGDVEPEPEMHLDDKEGVKRQTSDKSRQDVRT